MFLYRFCSQRLSTVAACELDSPSILSYAARSNLRANVLSNRPEIVAGD